MRNMLALFGAALLGLAGVGWYLGWYKVRNQPASAPGQHSVQIDFDTKKIGSDLEKAEHKLQQSIQNKAQEEAKKAADKDKELALPSPQLNVQMNNGTSLQMNNGDKGPLFEIHTDKGPTLEFGGGKGATLQFGADKK